MRMCSCRGTAGFAHVSCLVEEAKTLVAEGEENNLDIKVRQAKWDRWFMCSLCEQEYHGVVQCALGWACWKTYLGRPEANWARQLAMSVLASGLHAAMHGDDALSVYEAELSMLQRVGASERSILVAQGNIVDTYTALGRPEEALRLGRDVYREYLRRLGEEDRDTLLQATNYAECLSSNNRFEEAKELLRKMIPVARRVLAESDDLQFRVRIACNRALCENPAKTLDDLREAVSMLEEIEPTARRVLGGAHPIVEDIERRLPASRKLRDAQVALCAQVGDDVSSLREAMEAMASWTPDAIAAAAEKQGR